MRRRRPESQFSEGIKTTFCCPTLPSQKQRRNRDVDQYNTSIITLPAADAVFFLSFRFIIATD